MTRIPRDIGASVRARRLRLARERGEDFQLLHGVLAKAGPLFLFGELADIAVGGIHRKGDLLYGDVRGELVLEAVGVDEEAVVFLFKPLP